MYYVRDEHERSLGWHSAAALAVWLGGRFSWATTEVSLDRALWEPASQVPELVTDEVLDSYLPPGEMGLRFLIAAVDDIIEASERFGDVPEYAALLEHAISNLIKARELYAADKDRGE